MDAVELSEAQQRLLSELETGVESRPSWLQRLAQHHYGSSVSGSGAAYATPEQLLLDAGKFWAGAVETVAPGSAHECTQNSLQFASEHGLRLVQGVASSGSRRPVLHTWCVNTDDQVVDPTWGRNALGAVYFGIELPVELLMGIFMQATIDSMEEGRDRVRLTWFPILTDELLERPYDLPILTRVGRSRVGLLAGRLGLPVRPVVEES